MARSRYKVRKHYLRIRILIVELYQKSDNCFEIRSTSTRIGMKNEEHSFSFPTSLSTFFNDFDYIHTKKLEGEINRNSNP